MFKLNEILIKNLKRKLYLETKCSAYLQRYRAWRSG